MIARAFRSARQAPLPAQACYALAALAAGGLLVMGAVVAVAVSPLEGLGVLIASPPALAAAAALWALGRICQDVAALVARGSADASDDLDPPESPHPIPLPREEGTP
ncbi:hypothetical protein [Rubrivirga sp. IMCC45206]|uniref:hypothetical protein n=1 Tax=Rubrivirga sp. IMCC45206 TaxID=3391614 RepID=UPI0039901C95